MMVSNANPPAERQGRRLVRRPSSVTEVIGLLVSAALVLLILIPLGAFVLDLAGGDGGALRIIQAVLAEPDLPSLLIQTGVVVGASTFLAVAIACTFAWFNLRTTASIGVAGEALPILPLLVLPIAGTVGWVALASPAAGYANGLIRAVFGIDGGQGPIDIYSWGGMIALYTLYLVPQAYVVIAPALANLDSGYEEAAMVSGASTLSTYLRISLPAIRPALASAWLLVFIFALALYSVPAILAGRADIDILVVRIVRLLTTGYPPRLDAAVGLSLIVVLVVLVAWLVQRRITRNPRYAALAKNTSSLSSRIPIGPGPRAVIRLAMIAYIVVAAVLPFIALVVLSLQPLILGS